MPQGKIPIGNIIPLTIYRCFLSLFMTSLWEETPSFLAFLNECGSIFLISKDHKHFADAERTAG